MSTVAKTEEVVKTFEIRQLGWKEMNSIPNAMEVFRLGGSQYMTTIRQIGTGRHAMYQAKTVEYLTLGGSVTDVIDTLKEVESRIVDADLKIWCGMRTYGNNDTGVASDVYVTGWTVLTPDQVIAIKAVKEAGKKK